MGQKVYAVVIEDQKERYEEATAQISEQAYTSLADAKQAFNKAIVKIENDDDCCWVAKNWHKDKKVTVVKKEVTERWIEYYDKYCGDKLYVRIHEMELV